MILISEYIIITDFGTFRWWHVIETRLPADGSILMSTHLRPAKIPQQKRMVSVPSNCIMTFS